MTKEHQEGEWRKLAEAARTAGAGREKGGEAPPEGFVSHMRTLRAGLWEVARLLFWRKWSLVAVFVAVILYLVFYFIWQPSAPPSIPTPNPPSPPAP